MDEETDAVLCIQSNQLFPVTGDLIDNIDAATDKGYPGMHKIVWL